MTDPDATDPGITPVHYDIHSDSQNPPGPRAPEPLSHEPLPDLDSLWRLLAACRRLWRTSPRPRADATWPAMRNMLTDWEFALSQVDNPDAVWPLKTVRFYLGWPRVLLARLRRLVGRGR